VQSYDKYMRTWTAFVRGDVYRLGLSDRPRYVIVVQVEWLRSAHTAVVAASTVAAPTSWRPEIDIDGTTYTALPETVGELDLTCDEPIARVSVTDMDKIDIALKAVLGIK
jgi:hypothetical protein